MATAWTDTDSYIAQEWDGERRVTHVNGLSLSAARAICSWSPGGGLIGRVMSEIRDYCEVYTSRGCRKGTWAETTLVTIHTEPA